MSNHKISVAASAENYYFSFEPPVGLETLIAKEKVLNALLPENFTDVEFRGWPVGFLVTHTADEQVIGFPCSTFENDAAALKHATKMARAVGGAVMGDMVQDIRPDSH